MDLENTRIGIVSNLLLDTVLRYLELKINETAKFIIKELEVVSQVADKQFDRRFKRYDIEKKAFLLHCHNAIAIKAVLQPTITFLFTFNGICL